MHLACCRVWVCQIEIEQHRGAGVDDQVGRVEQHVSTRARVGLTAVVERLLAGDFDKAFRAGLGAAVVTRSAVGPDDDLALPPLGAERGEGVDDGVAGIGYARIGTVCVAAKQQRATVSLSCPIGTECDR